MKVKDAARCSQMSGYTFQILRCHIQQNSYLQNVTISCMAQAKIMHSRLVLIFSIV